MGAGIGGLVAALALARQGVPVQVFERAAGVGDVGAGISLGPPASRGLYALGLEAALRAAADVPAAIEAVHFETGEPLGGGFANRRVRDEDRPYLNQIHRADLYALLQAALEAAAPGALRLGQAFLGLEQDNEEVTVRFAGGGLVRGAALIGCDGIRSSVREAVIGPQPLRFTGRAVYRFLVPREAAAPFVRQGGSVSYVAPRTSLLRYAVRHGGLVNCVAFTLAEEVAEGWSNRVSREELLDLFRGWHPDVLGLVAKAPAEGAVKWGLFDRDPLENWTFGRVALLGDAAHPMLPFLGAGAGMAIEDGVVLGRSFGEAGDIHAALETYQRARLERANRLLLESRRQAEMFAEGPGTKREPTISREELADYDPSLVPL